MHDKLIKAFKQVSFITSHPDADWMKIFIVTIALLIYIISYSAFLYVDTDSDIESLGSSIVIKKPQAEPAIQKDDELSRIIKVFEEKSKKNNELKNSKATPLLDPISS
jgi:cell division protein FtsL